jgi:hypothetical protein
MAVMGICRSAKSYRVDLHLCHQFLPAATVGTIGTVGTVGMVGTLAAIFLADPTVPMSPTTFKHGHGDAWSGGGMVLRCFLRKAEEFH